MPHAPRTGAEYNTSAVNRIQSTFRRYSLGAVLSPIGTKELPTIAKQFLIRANRDLVPQKLVTPYDFHAIFQLTHTDGTISVAAWQTKFVDHLFHTDETICLVDISPDRKKRIGQITVGLRPLHKRPYFKDKPVVDWNGTEEKFQGQGYGWRRLVTTNALSVALFGLPVNSSSRFIGQERGSVEEHIWENLTQRGLATKYNEEDSVDRKRRFVFTTEAQRYYEVEKNLPSSRQPRSS